MAVGFGGRIWRPDRPRCICVHVRVFSFLLLYCTVLYCTSDIPLHTVGHSQILEFPSSHREGRGERNVYRRVSIDHTNIKFHMKFNDS